MQYGVQERVSGSYHLLHASAPCALSLAGQALTFFTSPEGLTLAPQLSVL